MTKLLLRSSSSLFLLANLQAQGWDWDNNADLTFWAPGMGQGSIHLGQIQGGGSGPQYVGNYWIYVIKGISGNLTLGNRNLYDQYWQPSKGWQNNWGGKLSWATFGFQINHQTETGKSLYLSISGDHAGATTGPVTTFLDQPMIIKSRGNWDTSITFVPHANPWFLPAGQGVSNKTPSGHITILADIYSERPEPTGELELSKTWVFPSESVTVSYSYDQGEDALMEGSYSSGGNVPTFIGGGGQ